MKLMDMEKDELRQLIRETVEQTIYHLIGDPDEGMQVKKEVKKRLKESLARQDNGEAGYSHKEVGKKLGFHD